MTAALDFLELPAAAPLRLVPDDIAALDAGCLPSQFIPLTRPPDNAATTAFVAQYCRAVADVLTGRRDPGQLRRHSALGVLAWLQQYAPRTAKNSGPAPRLIRVDLCYPGESAVEVAALFHVGPAVRAMTARFSHQNGAWRCVHAQVIGTGPRRLRRPGSPSAEA